MTTAAEHPEHSLEHADWALFQSNPHPMWVYDPITLAFLAVNDAAIANPGYTHDEFLGMTIEDICPPEDRAALRAREPDPESGNVISSGVWRLLHKDGRVTESEILASDVLFGGQRARLVVATDVTEARRSQRALLESEKRLQDLIDATSTVISVKALDGSYMLVNRRFEELTGFDREWVKGKTDDDLWPGPFAELLRANDKRALDALGPPRVRGEPTRLTDHVPRREVPTLRRRRGSVRARGHRHRHHRAQDRRRAAAGQQNSASACWPRTPRTSSSAIACVRHRASSTSRPRATPSPATAPRSSTPTPSSSSISSRHSTWR